MRPDKKKIMIGLKGLIADYAELLSLAEEQLAKERGGFPTAIIIDIVNKKDILIETIKKKDGLLKDSKFDGLKDDSDIVSLLSSLRKVINDIISLNSESMNALDSKKTTIFEGMGQLAGGRKITNGYAVNRSDNKGIVNIRE